jgi:hypothetical protein
LPAGFWHLAWAATVETEREKIGLPRRLSPKARARKAKHDGVVGHHRVRGLDAKPVDAGALLETMGRRAIRVFFADQRATLAVGCVEQRVRFRTDCHETACVVKNDGTRLGSVLGLERHHFIVLDERDEMSRFGVR